MALQRSMSPALRNCKIESNCSSAVLTSHRKDLGEIYRNELVNYSMIIGKPELDTMAIKFSSEQNTVSKEPMDLQFKLGDATKLPDGEELFKVAVKKAILFAEEDKGYRDFSSESIKYQVLYKSTAMVGIVKQDEKC
eukprot:CAMPEP_0170567852 /NCGR_PEP_ID=MMETSP0211-20121228/80748_1 /TAXON_ID=311385 /ORGANISM="Pseudokeronopsis sp., Strain OXSARD2" /LENGTH=136 /DNA_ID=CAMNT_0010889435 /DNA_START=442 /DNA_END=852 /DNA_ORIENTATION=-